MTNKRKQQLALLEIEKERIKQQRIKEKVRKRQPKSAILLQGIPRDLHDRFKAWCGMRGYTMTGKLKQVMFELVTGKIED